METEFKPINGIAALSGPLSNPLSSPLKPPPPRPFTLRVNKALNVILCVAAYGEFLKSQGETAVYWKRASSPEEVLKEADVVWINLFSSFSAPFSFSNFTSSVVRLEHIRFFQAATTTPECVLNSNRTSDGYTFCSEIRSQQYSTWAYICTFWSGFAD